MIRIAFIILVFLSTGAFAQQTSPSEQALYGKLSNEISLGLQCTVETIRLTQELAKTKERVKALEEKYEPKPK